MNKTTNPTKNKTTAPKKSKKATASDNSRDLDTRNQYLLSGAWRIVPMSKLGLANLIESLYSWLENDLDALCFEEFLCAHRISYNTYYKWLEEHSDLKDAHTNILMTLHTRRHKGALTRKYDGNFVLQTMPMYSKEWRKTVEWRENMRKQKDEQERRNITVIQYPTPMSDLVPFKKDKKDDNS